MESDKLQFKNNLKVTRSIQFGELWGIAFDGRGNCVVCDATNERVYIFDPEGKMLTQFTGDRKFQNLSCVCVALDGRVVVGDGMGVHMFAFW